MSTGPIAAAGFGGLAIAWFSSTALAWWLAIQRQFKAHEDWMIRSFALTLAAVTLRFQLGLAEILPFDSENSYRAIAFLCWVPNLVAAELYLRHRAGRLVRTAA